MKGLLERIDKPDDLKRLSMADLARLAEEIRHRIIEVVSVTGGHLGASLGAVELTLALHRVFDAPTDRIVWDVGHQAYTHKLLTGRRDRFHTLRQKHGISGFPRPSESPYDTFATGHASTAISAALGMAIARDIRGEKHRIVAVVGDGGLTGGLAYEGLNNTGYLGTDLLVVLNDNEMSISRNVGAIAKYLTHLVSAPVYRRFEEDVYELLGKLPKMGRAAQAVAHRIRESLQSLIIPTILFEELGFKYFGPIDGHDLPTLIRTLQRLRTLRGPVVLHTLSTKGKGYKFAEGDCEKFHGVGSFDKLTGECAAKADAISYTAALSESLIREAALEPRIVAITAAMPSGTGLAGFSKAYPSRFFDVGIAEAHAVTFAAGLASQGLRPVVAIYSTFLQRAFDQVIHDVALQKLNVVFILDRGGLVGEDGPTHQGAFDLAYLRTVPGLVVMSPKDENELRHMMHTAIAYPDGPIAVRFPRGCGLGVPLDQSLRALPIGEAEVLREGQDLVMLALGSMVAPARAAAVELEARGVRAAVLNARFLKPLDEVLISTYAERGVPFVTLEEGSLAGGFGSAVTDLLHSRGHTLPVLRIGIPDRFIDQAARGEQLHDLGLDARGIYRRVLEWHEQLEKSAVKLHQENA